MKKLSILLLAVMAFVACGNTTYSVDEVRAQEIKLNNQNDSINFLVGYVTGIQAKMHFFAADSTLSSTEKFVQALEDAYMGQEAEPESYDIDVKAANEAIYIGSSIREQEREGGFLGIDVLETNFDLVKQGFVHGLDFDTLSMHPDSANFYLNQVIYPLMMAQQQKMIEKAKAEGQEFLAENAKREGVKTTASGLQYEVLELGDGPKPTAESTVKVHYEGTFIDGKVFDSSYQHGEAIEFPLNGVIKGWTEGLQLMPAGSKYKLYIPYDLAYGEHGSRSIPPYTALIFTVELLEVK
jgi:FKBP-type peptidyl-prolyl cis-trans isomerase FklB